MKQIISFGVFLMIGVLTAVGQIPNNPPGRNLTLDSKVLYEHGYNKDFTTTPDVPRENVDTVMVTAVMNYFVMPDVYWNSAYFLQSNYSATNLTSSQFDWTVTLGTAVAQNANATSTSPWVKITWGTTTGAAVVTVKEVPQGLSDPACDGTPTTIPIHIIAKPTIGFNPVGTPPTFVASDCYTSATVASAFYDFPISVTTSSSEVLINYSVEKTDLITGTVTTTSASNVPVNAGIGILKVLFSDYGSYKVTITSITDRIARKCDVAGDINVSANQFTYNVMPAPQPASIFHVPNNF